MRDIVKFYVSSMDYIENMLYKQLVSAIGKEVQPVDFAKYMVFHNRKLMKPLYESKPFCYAVRRPDHFPEGVVSVEVLMPGDSIADPISTQVRRIELDYPMQFSLNAAT